jgi:hypothetical protein
LAKCSVEVRLERRGQAPEWVPAYRHDEQVAGAVHVVVSEPVRCKGLDLQLRHTREDHFEHAASKGYRNSGEPERLFEGNWEAGEHVYPFSLPAPWPPSHDGLNMSSSWALHAAADIPWARDPHDQSRFRVQPPTITSHREVRYTPMPLPRDAPSTEGTGIGERALQLARGLFGAPAQAEQGCQLEIEVQALEEGYRADASAVAAPVLRGVALTGPGEVVEHVWVCLEIYELTFRTKSSSEGGTHYEEVRELLWKQERRIEATADDRFAFELPLPEAGSMPFSCRFDARGRGLVWEVRAEVVRQGGGVAEVARRFVEVRPVDRNVPE